MSSGNISLLRRYSLFALFIALPLFEWRFINYNLFGSRAISPFVILYFLLATPSAITRTSFQVIERSSKECMVCVSVMYASLILFATTWSAFSADKTSGANTFTIAGMLLLFAVTHLVFLEYRSSIWKQVPRVIMCMTIIYPSFAILFLLLINGSSWIGYVDVVNRSDFTFSIRPYQVAVVATFSIFFGSAVCIGSRKENHVLWIVPLMGYVVALTGSRSGFAGLWILWIVFCVWVVREKIKVDSKMGGQVLAIKLICSILIWLTALALLPQTILFQRAIWGDSQGIPTPSNSAREQLWRIALKNGPASGQEPKLDATDFGSFHNVFLDIYVSSGYPALFFFIVFLTVTAIALIRSLYMSTSYQDRIIRYAMLLCFATLIAQAFINPMLSFSAAWIMLGIIAASITSYDLIDSR